MSVAVLGPHRSGTSCVTRALHLLGLAAPCGSDLMDGPDNPLGHWESRALSDFNEQLLERFQGTWATPPPDLLRWDTKAEREWWEERGAATFGTTFPERNWVFKDPRLSLLLPFWRSIWPTPPTVVLCHRAPRDACASLIRREGIHPEQAFALWRLYSRAMLDNAASLATFVVDYEQLTRAPIEVLAALADFLTHRGLEIDRNAVPDAAGTIRPASAHEDLAGDRPSEALAEFIRRLPTPVDAMPEVDAPASPEADQLLLEVLRHSAQSSQRAAAPSVNTHSRRTEAPATDGGELVHDGFAAPISSPDAAGTLFSEPNSRARFAVETRLAWRKQHQDTFQWSGFCSVDERPVEFTVAPRPPVRIEAADWLSSTSEEVRVPIPNWNETQLCPLCGLNSRQRAMVTLARRIWGGYPTGSTSGQILATDGQPALAGIVSARVRSVVWRRGQFCYQRGFEESDGQLVVQPVEEASASLVVASNVFERSAEPVAALAELARVVRPVGTILLPVPFALTARRAVSAAQSRALDRAPGRSASARELEQTHWLVFGWDLVDTIREDGRFEPHVLLVWAPELGHLGPQVFLELRRGGQPTDDTADAAAECVVER